MSYIFDFQEVHRIQTDLGHLQQKWRIIYVNLSNLWGWLNLFAASPNIFPFTKISNVERLWIDLPWDLTICVEKEVLRLILSWEGPFYSWAYRLINTQPKTKIYKYRYSNTQRKIEYSQLISKQRRIKLNYLKPIWSPGLCHIIRLRFICSAEEHRH
jgi:hypothetical protein